MPRDLIIKPPLLHRIYHNKHLLASDYPYIKDMKDILDHLYGLFLFFLFDKILTIPAIHASVLPLKRAN